MYEVEIKSLLGSKENAEKLKKSLARAYPDAKLVGKGRQLNHYFNLPPDLARLEEAVAPLIPADKKAMFEQILRHGTKISLRTRDADDKIILVMKASVGSDTSSNGVTRMEFEAVVPKTLAELDGVLLGGGCTYQAKWSREREEYVCKGVNVTLDKNAGYGWLAEFERVVDDASKVDAARAEVTALMTELNVQELPQDRLERMFAFYNEHWPEYYGTEKVFVIE